MYKIIDKLPDNLSNESIEEKYIEYFIYYFVDVMDIRGEESVESIIEKLENNFQNLPENYTASDIILISSSDLLKPKSYFLRPREDIHIKFLYDTEKNKYYKLKYKGI